MVKEKVLKAEAKRRGLYPTVSETQKYIESIRSEFEDARARGLLDKESEDQRKELLSVLDLTEEQYW